MKAVWLAAAVVLVAGLVILLVRGFVGPAAPIGIAVGLCVRQAFRPHSSTAPTAER